MIMFDKSQFMEMEAPRQQMLLDSIKALKATGFIQQLIVREQALLIAGLTAEDPMSVAQEIVALRKQVDLLQSLLNLV